MLVASFFCMLCSQVLGWNWSTVVFISVFFVVQVGASKLPFIMLLYQYSYSKKMNNKLANYFCNIDEVNFPLACWFTYPYIMVVSVHSCSTVFSLKIKIFNSWKLKTTAWKSSLNQLTCQISSSIDTVRNLKLVLFLSFNIYSIC